MDKIPENLPPLPWGWTTNAVDGKHPGTGYVYLTDARGRKIATIYGSPIEKIAIIEVIVDAAKKLHEQQKQDHAQP